MACGMGQNALWLAERGYRTTAIDISPVALARGKAEAEARGLTVNFVQADLDNYTPPQEAFDLVVVFRFLNRRLLPAIEASLRPGGWLFYRTFNTRRLEKDPDIAPEYLLEVGELAQAFSGLELVESKDEGEVSYAICRRPQDC